MADESGGTPADAADGGSSTKAKAEPKPPANLEQIRETLRADTRPARYTALFHAVLGTEYTQWASVPEGERWPRMLRALLDCLPYLKFGKEALTASQDIVSLCSDAPIGLRNLNIILDPNGHVETRTRRYMIARLILENQKHLVGKSAVVDDIRLGAIWDILRFMPLLPNYWNVAEPDLAKLVGSDVHSPEIFEAILDVRIHGLYAERLEFARHVLNSNSHLQEPQHAKVLDAIRKGAVDIITRLEVPHEKPSEREYAEYVELLGAVGGAKAVQNIYALVLSGTRPENAIEVLGKIGWAAPGTAMAALDECLRGDPTPEVASRVRHSKLDIRREVGALEFTIQVTVPSYAGSVLETDYGIPGKLIKAKLALRGPKDVGELASIATKKAGTGPFARIWMQIADAAVTKAVRPAPAAKAVKVPAR